MSDTVVRLNSALQGRYRIERQLGEGGMATVYLADDLRHERKVALKVLKPELAAVVGAERFLAEIKTTANLQHPHILPLFDSGEADTFLFYVMPYVDGESLRDRLDRERQLPVDDAVRIAASVAEALDYAHRQGVIHRDIKPANIMLLDGKPVISDFGIALAVRVGGGGRLTETGLTLGTPHYMSPEQATGDEAVGATSDVYSVGCVLYEMLVGEPPYTGSTPQAILGRIIAGEAEPASAHRRSVPPHVDAAIQSALEKIPADRFRTAGDLARALQNTAFSYARQILPPQPYSMRRPSGATTATAVAAVLAVLAAWGWLGRSPAAPPTGSVSRLTLALTGEHRLAIDEFESFPLALSSDGRLVAYVGESRTDRGLYVRSLDAFEPMPLDGTDGARQPFFSPDGQSVAYFARDGLFQVPVSGGAPIRITRIPLRPGTEVPVVPAGAAWGPDGLIVIAGGETDLWLVPAAGGEPEVLQLHNADAPATEPIELQGGRGVRWPSFLPGGAATDDTRVLVTIDNELHVVSLADGSAQPLDVEAGGQGRYTSSGHLVYTQTSGAVRAVPFDAASLRVTGAAVPVVDDVYRPTATFATLFALSSSGSTLVYVPGGSERRLMRVDRGGRATPLPFEPASYRFPRLSPTGNLLAVDERSGPLWVFDLTTGSERRWDGAGAPGPWLSERFVTGDIPALSFSLTPGELPGRIPGVPDTMFIKDVSPTGRVILNKPFTREANLGGVYAATIGSDQPAVQLADGEAHESSGRISPDGRLFSFTSDMTGRTEVYVQPLDASAPPVLVSVSGGRQPLWSPSGDDVLFWSAEGLYSARLLSDDSLRFAPPEILFEGRYYLQEPGTWDVSPSGDFVLISAGPNWLREIQVVQGFGEELDQLVPVD